jgi:hypothetical protein
LPAVSLDFASLLKLIGRFHFFKSEVQLSTTASDDGLESTRPLMNKKRRSIIFPIINHGLTAVAIQ